LPCGHLELFEKIAINQITLKPKQLQNEGRSWVAGVDLQKKAHFLNS
jgi:hypothetical protein